MFQQAQTLDKKLHAHLRYTPADDYSFAADLTMAPLAPQEITAAAQCYPVLFAPTGNVTAIAVLGLRDRNVFLNDKNQWLDSYIPAHVRRYPFIFGRIENTDKLVLAADVTAPQFASTEGEALFIGDGDKAEINPHFNGMLELLSRFEQDMQDGQAIMAELASSGVLVSKDLGLREGEALHLIAGFRTVDRAKVEALDDATLARWARNGLMSLIELHWASYRHMAKIAVAASRPEQVQ